MTAPLVSTTDRPFQLLPPLTVEQRDLLRQSIKENGVLEPVVFDEDGEILDGHHRVEIAEELGIEYPRRVIDDLDRPGKHMYALTVNVARRQLDQAARSGLVAQMRIRGMSIRQIASALGVGVATVHRDLGTVPSGTVPDRITGADGKERPATRPKAAPNLTADVERALGEAGPSGMTAWQLAFLINPAGPDAERAELTVRMAPVLESLAGAGRACVVGEVDGGALWALAELVDAETPGPAADAPAVAGPGSTSGASSLAPEPETCLGADMDCGRPLPCPDHPRTPEERIAAVAAVTPELVRPVEPAPKPTLRVAPDPDQVRAAEQRDARALLSRGVDLLAPPRWNESHVEAWIKQLGPYDEELAELTLRAAAAIAVLDRIIEEAGR